MSQNHIDIHLNHPLFPVAPHLYGLFFEDINRAADGGIYPEMLRNRSFEDSLVPPGCTTDPGRCVLKNRGGWPGAFNHGEGMDDWAERVPYTDIPAWYSQNAILSLCQFDTLNTHRLCSLRICFQENGQVWNVGYNGMYVQEGETYNLILFFKTDSDRRISLSLEAQDGKSLASASLTVSAQSDWQKLELDLTALRTDTQARFVLSSDPGELTLGYTSLLPANTFRGHGLRPDIVQILKDSHPALMRYPGGCVVEGISYEMAMRFSHTIGLPWERPSTQLMWHYRTTNGFGFHEFLQLCEDLDIAPLYVANCGMSCQARIAEYFDQAGIDEMLQEALNALEYALGSADTHYGAIRASMGHPAPFALKYVQIGNENFGPEYNERYQLFYNTLKQHYPQIEYISSGHTEEFGLPTDYADEHYYDTPEFFYNNANRFDDYTRNGPKIILGEYAVNGGRTIASMECALAEAAFLTGVERNQDLIAMAAYAPLLHNADYSCWLPNLIAFNNHQVYGIPSYHVISLFAENRGTVQIASTTESAQWTPVYHGLVGLMCEQSGLTFRNARLNGNPVAVSRVIYGACRNQGETTALCQSDQLHSFTGKSDAWNKAFEDFIYAHRKKGIKDDNDKMWILFGSEDLTSFTFEIDIKCQPDNALTLSIWNQLIITDAGCNEPRDYDWNLRSVSNKIWKIADGQGTTETRSFFEHHLPAPAMTDLHIDYNHYNTYKIVANKEGYQCYINNRLMHCQSVKTHNSIYTSVSADEKMIYIKLVCTASEAQNVKITLDKPVTPDYEVWTVRGQPDDMNSFDAPNHVSRTISNHANASEEFIFTAAPYSVNVIRLRRA